MPPEAGHFDICGPLPGPGVTILEASAGTGKTFTIAALVARLVAEGLVTSVRDPGRHLHPDGHRRTERPGAGTTGIGRARSGPDAGRR